MRTQPQPLREAYRLPDTDHHVLIPVERAEHPGAVAFECLRMFPGQMSERWIYERWTLKRFDGLDQVANPDHAARMRAQAEMVWRLVADRYRGLGRSQRVIFVPAPEHSLPNCRFCGRPLDEESRDGHLYLLRCECGARLRYIYRAVGPLPGWNSLGVDRMPDDHPLGGLDFEERLDVLHREWAARDSAQPARYEQMALL